MHPKSLIFILLFGCIGASSLPPVQSYPHNPHNYPHQKYLQNLHDGSPPRSTLYSQSVSSSSFSSPSVQYPSSSYPQQPQHYHHHQYDYETSDGSSNVPAVVAYPPSSMSMHSNDDHHYSESAVNSHNHGDGSYGYDQRGSSMSSSRLNQAIYDHPHQQQKSQSQQSLRYASYGDLEKSSSQIYDSDGDHGIPAYQDNQDSRDNTVGELYYKRPTVESEYEALDASPSASDDDYGYQQQQMGKVTSTEYKTGEYIRPKSYKYPNALYGVGMKPMTTKTVAFTVPQTTTGYPKEHKSPIPSIEIPGLDKLLPSDAGVKFPSIDFNFILGNLFGQKGPPSISLAAPEGAGNLLTHLVGVGKPISVNAPDIEILGKNTKIQGFNVPEFTKLTANTLKNLDFPKLDLSGQGPSGLSVPHIDLPTSHSIGKSPKITAIPPLGPSIHILKHLPLPSIPKFKLPEIGTFKNFKIPKLDLTKIQKKDGLASAEDTLRPTYVQAPIKSVSGIPKPAFDAHPIANAITLAKAKKIVTAYPLQKGPLSGHVVVEDYPFGRRQYGPLDDGGEPEIGCAELDKIIHAKPLASNSLYGSKRPLI